MATKMEDVEPTTAAAEGPSFSPELLKLYYERLFPYREMCQWLGLIPDSVGSSGVSTTTTTTPGWQDKESLSTVASQYLLRRELTFTLANDVYCRYQSFANAWELKAAMLKAQPHKIDIGAVYNVSPREKSAAAVFRPDERELVFDVDLSDYDDVRTCCQGATVCRKCWKFVVAAVRVVDVCLREDFGFQHILWVYSGRRGVHCWVSDKVARELTNEARSAVVSYLTVVRSFDGPPHNLVWPLHPSLERAFAELEPIFEKHVISDNGQGHLARPELWAKFLKTLPDDVVAERIGAHWDKTEATKTIAPRDKWLALKSLSSAKRAKSKSSSADGRASQIPELWKTEALFRYCYPRLDENVSRQRNHLLKAPFAVHPKTGRVCVPFDPKKVDQFDPTAVVTVADLADQLDAANKNHDSSTKPGGKTDLEKTALHRAVKEFRKLFLEPLLRSVAADQRNEREKTAAFTGDF